jgi:integrase
MRAVRSMIKAASRQGNRPIGVRELFLNPDLLAAAACDPARLDGRGDEPLTYGSFALRRIAARCFMRLMENYLGDADSLIAAFEAALRSRSERVGGLKFRPKAGRPTGRRTRAPRLPDIQALLRELASSRQTYIAERNVAFVCLLASTGLRLSSAVGIDGADFYRLASGLWVEVREKCKDERVQVRIPPEGEAAMQRYVAAFNRHSFGRGSPERIGFGIPGPFWRSQPGRPWTASGVERTVQQASGRACWRAFGPHAIRHFVAEELSKRLPRSSVADALRLDGCTTLDQHYAPPPGTSASSTPSQPAAPAEQGGGIAAATEKKT